MTKAIFTRKVILSTLLLCVLSLSAQANNLLDSLFMDLKHSSNETEARKLEGLIWKTWLKSGDNKIDGLMQQALRKRRGYDFNGALEILDQVVELKPDYSEGWNQRATVYFLQAKYEKSLEDIARTLELEPRHFGSLAGRAVIRMKQLKPILARQNIKEAMKYHPYLKERHMFPSL